MGSAAGNCEIARLPEDLLSAVLALTTPRDACRAAAVSRTFREAAEADAVWARFVPENLPPIAAGELAGPAPPSKKERFLRLSDSRRPVLLADGLRIRPVPQNPVLAYGLKSMWLDRGSGAKCYMLLAWGLHISWGRNVALLALDESPRLQLTATAMASSSHSTPFGAPHSAPSSLEPYRDQAGFLPLVPCHKCGTVFIGRVSQKPGSKGKRFYKCPMREHTDYACGVYFFEEQYVEYLVSKGVLPRACSLHVRGRDAMALEVMKEGKDKVKACQAFDASQDLLESAVIHLKDSEALLQSLIDSNKKLMTNMDKIGERLLVVGVVKVFVLVLVLLVLLVK